MRGRRASLVLQRVVAIRDIVGAKTLPPKVQVYKFSAAEKTNHLNEASGHWQFTQGLLWICARDVLF